MIRNERIQKFQEIMQPVIQKCNPLIVSELTSIGFFDSPASTKYHCAYEGGLFDHSFHVTDTLLRLTKDCNLQWTREESPLIVGMLHDICKADTYIKEYETDFEFHWEYNPNTLLKGHGDKSIMLLSKWLTLTTEEVLCIRYHMGAFTDKSEWNDYTRAIHAYPNVLWTHHADMIATHVLEVD